MKDRNKITMDITDNRSVYNKMRKRYLEDTGKIHCARCPYHRGENDERKYYGSWLTWRSKGEHVRYPNWKLVSKNRKQWMKKMIKKEVTTYLNGEYSRIRIKF